MVFAPTLLLAAGATTQPRPPRGRLVYKHLAKTGGQAIIAALRAQYAPLITDGTLIVKTEQQPVTPEDAREAYIISSVRNPCALYVSLWAWGVADHGRYNRLFKERHASDPAMAHVFDDVSNTSAFGSFARASLGEFSRRYRDYVPAMGAVDCWVHTEAADADFQRCLAAFELQAPRDVAARMRAASWRSGGGGGAIRSGTAGDGARTAVDNGMRSLSEKANASGLATYNIHQSHHQPCEFYFRADPDLVGLILQVSVLTSRRRRGGLPQQARARSKRRPRCWVSTRTATDRHRRPTLTFSTSFRSTSTAAAPTTAGWALWRGGAAPHRAGAGPPAAAA